MNKTTKNFYKEKKKKKLLHLSAQSSPSKDKNSYMKKIQKTEIKELNNEKENENKNKNDYIDDKIIIIIDEKLSKNPETDKNI